MSQSTHKRRGHFKKMHHNPNAAEGETPTADFLYKEVFQEYQRELDTKHDRHERLVKLSRDCTIRSKRVIFLLHRATGNDSSKDSILAEAEEKIRKDILFLLQSIASELLGEDPKKHHKAYSPGLQEFIEALSYLEFLKSGRLVKIQDIQHLLTFQVKVEPVFDEGSTKSQDRDDEDIENSMAKRPCLEEQQSELILPLDPIDYVLGVADLTGELMRLCINSVGCGDRDLPFQLLPFIRAVYCGFLSLGPVSKEMGRKISTLKSSVLKVENVCYTLKIRGSEVPEHMLVHVLTTSSQDNNITASESEQF